eukprot:gene24323-29403_t
MFSSVTGISKSNSKQRSASLPSDVSNSHQKSISESTSTPQSKLEPSSLVAAMKVSEYCGGAVTVVWHVQFLHCISGMSHYSNKSPEELRLEDYRRKCKYLPMLSSPLSARISSDKPSNPMSDSTVKKEGVGFGSGNIPFRAKEVLEMQKGVQCTGYLQCISGMFLFCDKSMEELRWEDYFHNNRSSRSPSSSSKGFSKAVVDTEDIAERLRTLRNLLLPSENAQKRSKVAPTAMKRASMETFPAASTSNPTVNGFVFTGISSSTAKLFLELKVRRRDAEDLGAMLLLLLLWAQQQLLQAQQQLHQKQELRRRRSYPGRPRTTRTRRMKRS